MKHRFGLCALAAVLIASNAAAQGAMTNLRGQNQDLPVQIEARTLEVHDRVGTATFTGDVKVVQGDTTMTCQTLVVFYGKDAGSKVADIGGTATDAAPTAQNIRRIEARGKVTVVSKDQTATGDLGIYDLKLKTITLTGNVIVSQGKDVIHGERLVVNTVTGVAHMEAAPGGTQGRVRALIIPNKDRGSGGPSNFMTIGPGPAR